MTDVQRDPVTPTDDETGVLGPRYRALTLGVLLSVGMVAFESLGVATVLPVIARDLDGLGAYGWGLSALMLANVVGTALAGRAADRRGPAGPMTLGMVVFLAGCVVAGVAGSWPLFLVGRVLQGLGVGAVMAMAYTVIGLAYPEALRARMFALLSSAWTIPSLVGPFAAGLLADGVGWRWVFGMMLPVVAVAAALTLPALRRLPHATGADAPAPAAVPWWRGPLVSSVQLTVGTALLLHALLLRDVRLLVVLAVVGVVTAVPALRRVTPAGTLAARRGVAAGIVVRALLSGAYFGSEAFLPLGLQELRGQSATAAGLGLSAGALTWVAGSFLQARWDVARPTARGRGVAVGSAVLLVGTAAIALTILTDAVPAWCAVLGWAVAGLGMGVAFNASTTETLGQAPATQQGLVSSSLQLAQTLATALVAGVGGAALAHAGTSVPALRAALVAVFVATGVLATLSVLLSRRLRS
ncbi:MFS transporter [Cellulomonas iranensis]|uniref:MFS transporter n=1 Tax=Cellulomonas iranensis TaxID=76862 RepID=UPI000B3CF09C|nr:MFS transporter [Cellulomonas iranensis]